LPFELLADFERKMIEAYSVRRDDVEGYYGVAQRSVFVIDQAGVIRWVWERAPGKSLPDFDEVVKQALEVAGAARADEQRSRP
jgi:glutaredoxin-dependent peroxiredoxin